MPPKLFISYSMQDADFKEQLLKALNKPKREHQISIWHDQDIEIGCDIALETQHAMKTANIAILLISKDYFDDHFEEYEKLLGASHLLKLPIFVKHCLYPDNLNKFKGLNAKQAPLASFEGNELDKALMDIAQKILQVVQRIDNKNEALDFNQRIQKIKEAIPSKFTQIFTVISNISNYIINLENKGSIEDQEPDFLVLESFLLDKADCIDLSHFIEFCQTNLDQNNAAKKANASVDYLSFAQRLKNGEVTLFLGMEMDIHCSAQFIAKNLVQTDDFNGLAEACEQIELKTSRGNLVNHLTEQLKEHDTKYLYELLSKIPEPLLIISAHYDNCLEEQFKKKHKKYVRVFQHWSRKHFRIMPEALTLEYSDQNQSKTCLPEDLAGEMIFESGYSLIYKLRGCFQNNRKDNFILSEYEHLDLLRTIRIPGYVIEKLDESYLWFLGHHLQSWEERMLIRLILNEAQPKTPIAIQENVNDYFQKYWREITRVDPYSISLPEFINNLNKNL